MHKTLRRLPSLDFLRGFPARPIPANSEQFLRRQCER